MNEVLLEQLFESQSRAHRNPVEIFGTSFERAGIKPETLLYEADDGFIELINSLKITLIVGREYENLVLSLTSSPLGVKQTFFHLPHPSGIIYDPIQRSLYLASTRNPNQIIEFKCTKEGILMPIRSKYYPGSYYFHDLALIGGKLHANAVGYNGIIAVDLSQPTHETICWWPKCIENGSGIPNTTANFIQLNSIASCQTLDDSFFSATADQMTLLRPGHPNYPVDRRGVIFSGRTREPIASGLTRPHSTRIHNGKIWVCNSGYGEFGYIEDSGFISIMNLNSWTRGLSLYKGIAFVGISRVLPKFKSYAPGIETGGRCGLVAIDILRGKRIGSMMFPYGNQIFAIEVLPQNSQTFAFEKINQQNEETTALFYNFKLREPHEQ